MGAETPELLEWFRVDRSRATTKLLIIGTVLVFVGASLVAAGFVTHSDSAWLTVTAWVGSLVLIVGLVTAFGGLTVLIARDEYVGVRVDGVLVHHVAEETLVPWSDLARVDLSEDGREVRLHVREGAPVVLRQPYSDVSQTELAAHLEEIRRKASLGTIDAASVRPLAARLRHPSR